MHRGVFACQACTFCLKSPIVLLCSLALPRRLSHFEKGPMLLLDLFLGYVICYEITANPFQAFCELSVESHRKMCLKPVGNIRCFILQ